MHRCNSGSEIDGIKGSKGVFLACGFWFGACTVSHGRSTRARERFEQLLPLRKDVGLLVDEYAPKASRQLAISCGGSRISFGITR